MRKTILLLVFCFATVGLKAQGALNTKRTLLQVQAIQELAAAIESGQDILSEEQCAKNGILEIPLQVLYTIVMPTITAL